MDIKIPQPIAYLESKQTNIRISVYSKFTILQRFMIKLCFGLEYKKL